MYIGGLVISSVVFIIIHHFYIAVCKLKIKNYEFYKEAGFANS